MLPKPMTWQQWFQHRHSWIRRPGIRVVFPCLIFILSALMIGNATAAWEYDDWAVAFEDTSHISNVVVVSDGREGMIIVGIHQVPGGYHRIWVNRFDHTGTEIWGNDGVYLTVDLSAQWDYGPLDVVADLTGGAYVGFRRGFGTHEMYMVAHVKEGGAVHWISAIDQVGTYSIDHPGMQVELGTFGGVFAFYIQFDTSEFQKIKVVHFDTEGAVYNFSDVYSSTTAKRVFMISASDWPSGALVVWSRYDGGVLETGAQRIISNSNRYWGNDGVHVMTDMNIDPVIMSDGSNGAFIVAADNGQAWGQHLDAVGAEQWAAGGKILHDSHGLYPTDTTFPDICSDGAGGFFLLHGREDAFVQRVTSSGSLPWGAGGIHVATDLGYTDAAGRITYDGFEGAVLSYNTSYDIDATGYTCAQIRGMRLDVGGGIMWDRPLWSCEYSWNGGTPEVDVWPRESMVVADGTGGAMYVWKEAIILGWAPGYQDLRTLARGINPAGEPAIPRLSNMIPGSGRPGDLLIVNMFGEYLHPDQTFRIHKDDDPPITITGNWVITNQHIQGDLDLTGAPDGIYGLTVSTGPTDHDTLHGAMAVGSPLPCLPDAPFGPNPSIPITGGNRRKADFAPDGTLHMAWCEFQDSHYRIYRWDDTMGLEEGALVVDTIHPVRQLSFGIGDDGVFHYTYVTDVESDQTLEYIRDPRDGTGLFDSRVFPSGVRSPALVVAGSNAHIVLESDIGSDSWLFHVPIIPSGLGATQDLISGPNSREADLAEGDGGLILAFVRDHEVPGLREVCYQFYNGSTWEPPVPLSAGLSLYSPSVVWDNDLKTMFAWIQDPTGSDPVLHTCLMEAGVPGPMRWRPSDGIIYAVSVDSPGSNVFYLMTQESETGIPMNMYLRRGNGEAFYPAVRLNSSDDVDLPFFKVEYLTHRIAAWWEEYSEPEHPYHYATCHFDISGSTETPPVAKAMMMVYPNPFNPATSVVFNLPEAGRTKLALYDLRGRQVRSLLDEDLGVGPHTVPWDGRDDQGRSLASGVYFGKLTLPGGRGELVNKLALIR